MSENYIEVLDPRGVPVSDTNELAERPASLQEATLGILSNSKPNGDRLLMALQQELGQRIHFTDVVYRSKGASSIPAPEEVMQELEQCDVVVNAVGD